MEECKFETLFAEGYKDAAERFLEESGLEFLQPWEASGCFALNGTSTTAKTPISATTDGVTLNGATTSTNGATNGATITTNGVTSNGVKEGTRSHWMSELSETMVVRVRVRRELEAGAPGYVRRVTAMLTEHFPDLLDIDRLLGFRLLQLELIELIRDRQLEKALDFAQVSYLTLATYRVYRIIHLST